MAFVLRNYQSEAVGKGLDFLNGNNEHNEFEILPTGSGKSVVIANITKELKDMNIVLQPSKEILEQNFKKFSMHGIRAGIYSASAGSKYIEQTTFCTIGSIIKKKHLFKNVKNILIDECHLVNPEDGMYRDFIKSFPRARVLGFTATPYRLSTDFEGAQLKFLNRTNPKIFNKVGYYVQNNTLFDAGHLAPLEYYNFDVVDRSKLKINNSGTDFTEASMREYYRQINMSKLTIDYANDILSKRNNLLVFCSTIQEATEVSRGVPGSVVLSSLTTDAERSRILSQFKAGVIRCVINVGILTTGFDYPELEAVLISRSTMSLALYYQIIGRIMRPFTYPDGTKKVGWVYDLGGNINLFGKIETMEIRVSEKGLFSIWNNGRQLTNTPFTRN